MTPRKPRTTISKVSLILVRQNHKEGVTPKKIATRFDLSYLSAKKIFEKITENENYIENFVDSIQRQKRPNIQRKDAKDVDA